MKKIIRSFGLLALLLLAVVFLDIGCVFRRFTGIPCPGCGTTRACIQFLQGHVVDAFYYHPLFWLTVILLVVMVLKDGRMFRSQKANRWFWIVILLMYLSVYLVRMFLLFPDTPPMELNEQAPFWKLWEWFRTSCM